MSCQGTLYGWCIASPDFGSWVSGSRYRLILYQLKTYQVLRNSRLTFLYIRSLSQDFAPAYFLQLQLPDLGDQALEIP